MAKAKSSTTTVVEPVAEEQVTPVEETVVEAEVVAEETPVAETETIPEEVVEEVTQPEPEAAPADLKPRPRTRGSRLIKTEIKPQESPLGNITIEEVVQRKHGFDLKVADGALKEVIDFLDRYEDSMKDSVNVEASVAESLQKQLFKNYLKIFTFGGIERTVAMEYLLWKFFRNEKRTFRVSNLSRFTRNGRWNALDLQMFLQLNNLFNLIKDPSDRIARLRTIRIGQTVEKFPADKIRYSESLIAWASSLK